MKHLPTREVEGTTELRCTGCDLWVPYDADHFNRGSRASSGLQTPCKRCQRANSKAWQRRHYHPLKRAA